MGTEKPFWDRGPHSAGATVLPSVSPYMLQWSLDSRGGRCPVLERDCAGSNGDLPPCPQTVGVPCSPPEPIPHGPCSPPTGGGGLARAEEWAAVQTCFLRDLWLAEMPADVGSSGRGGWGQTWSRGQVIMGPGGQPACAGSTRNTGAFPWSGRCRRGPERSGTDGGHGCIEGRDRERDGLHPHRPPRECPGTPGPISYLQKQRVGVALGSECVTRAHLAVPRELQRGRLAGALTTAVCQAPPHRQAALCQGAGR